MLKVFEAIVGLLQFLKTSVMAFQHPITAAVSFLLFLAIFGTFVGLTKQNLIAKTLRGNTVAKSNKDSIG